MQKIIIPANKAGQRIDKFLATADGKSGHSRSQLQKKIKNKLIAVNNKPVSSHYRLKEKDIINFIEEKRAASPGLAKGRAIKGERPPACKIVSQTKNYLVINKPCGLAVHGAEHMKEITLVDLIVKKYPAIAKVGADPTRPGIVHRIDKEVSGLLLVAKNQEFFDYVKKQFQQRKIDKKYTALVYGKILKDQGIIDFPIERSASGHKMAAKPVGQGGKTAISEFRVINRYINYSLIEIIIKTGRTHQIRAHLAAYGAPIVGDNLYGTKTTRAKNLKLKTKRIFLVARELSFFNLRGEKKNFKIPLPKEFIELLNQIK